MGRLEHVNVTVEAPERTAAVLCALFDWKVRWKGPAKMGGFTVHVGSDEQYLALFAPPEGLNSAVDPGLYRSGLNHIGIVVDDLDACEARILAAGYTTGSHSDYEPGRRFYFTDENGVEIEVVSYQP
jgi:catechol 2,3-dioxygenase-like lactoylglutathione lyase family enzyme